MNSNSTTIDTLNTDLKARLEKLSGHTDIAGHVAREALEYDNPEMFFEDLSRYGCICGMVGSLIYYTDTHAFFDEHYAEIQEIKDDWEDNVGEPLQIKGDLKNFLAWFAFEEIAYRLGSEREVL